MPGGEPVAELDSRYSSEGATPPAWAEARAVLDDAKIFWLTTVRPDGRPHVTSLFAVWLNQVMYFCTGNDERKAKNLARSPHCVLTTGCNVIAGLDLVIEGDAVRVRDEALLQRLADRWASKYGWHFTVRDGAIHGEDGNEALMYEVAPSTVFGFGKGATFSQTRWRMQPDD